MVKSTKGNANWYKLFLLTVSCGFVTGFTNQSLHGSSHPDFPDDFSEPVEPLDDERDEYYLKNNSQLVSIELSMATMG